MPRLPEKTKSRILKSKSFKKWKLYRRKSKALPKVKSKDLLRAYQIDRALKAKEKDISYWKKAPHRADIRIDTGEETWSRRKRRRRKFYSKRRR